MVLIYQVLVRQCLKKVFLTSNDFVPNDSSLLKLNMSSPEVERFEVTDEDLANEFNPNRHTYRQSKNKAIYGKFVLAIQCFVTQVFGVDPAVR